MKLIGRYEVRGLLGRGGMGVVYKVRLPALSKIMALKLLAPQPALTSLLAPDEIRRGFITEAETLGRLRHPNLVSIVDFENTPDLTFFVMEYYCRNLGEIIGEGYDLEAASRRLDVDKAVNYTLQTLQGLSRLHYAGVIHRDIKPFNLLITDQDQVKITDLGLSLLRGETTARPETLKVGSPFYAAPEQIKAPDSAGPQADLYSVGVMLHRLITGRLPETDHRPASVLNPVLDESWDFFLARAMNPDPEKRFSSAGMMNAALKSLMQDWSNQRSLFCPAPPPPIIDSGAIETVRRTPVKARPSEAMDVFGLDELWRPKKYYRPDLAPQKDGTVHQSNTGLLWEMEGPDFPLTYEEALERLEELNRTGFAGRNNWRLPTVNELLTLLVPPVKETDACLSPAFPADRTCLWTSDRRSAMAGWYVNMDHGFASWQDYTCSFHVRGVCDAGPPEQ